MSIRREAMLLMALGLGCQTPPDPMIAFVRVSDSFSGRVVPKDDPVPEDLSGGMLPEERPD